MSDQEPQEGQTRSGFATLFDLLLSAALFGAATWMLVTALQWPWESGLFPGIVAGVMMALAAIQLARQILQMVSRRGAAGGSRVVDLTVDEDLPVALVVRRATALWVWILGLFASILLIGFVLSIPLFVLLYHIIQGRERITVAAAWASPSGCSTCSCTRAGWCRSGRLPSRRCWTPCTATSAPASSLRSDQLLLPRRCSARHAGEPRGRVATRARRVLPGQ